MEDQKSNSKLKIGWLKKIGVFGFLFFLVKGLIWLALGFGAWKKLMD